ncbi:MAG: hypothetical protein AAB738_00395 [Patescibacteria group bacterium]
MAGLKPAKVTGFFKTLEKFEDSRIVAQLKGSGITVVSEGPGGYPDHDVYHLDDIPKTWVGSRLDGYDGRILAFFSSRRNDPIFAAVNPFAVKVAGKERRALTSTLAKAKRAREKIEIEQRIKKTAKARAAEARGEMAAS